MQTGARQRTIFASALLDSTGASMLSTESLAKAHLQARQRQMRSSSGGVPARTHVSAAAATNTRRSLDEGRIPLCRTRSPLQPRTAELDMRFLILRAWKKTPVNE